MKALSPTAQLESQRLAEDVFALLQTLDPLRWRGEGATKAGSLLERVASRTRVVLEHAEAAAQPRLRESVHEVHSVVGGFQAEAPSAGREAWQALRRKLHPAYEALAQSLRSQSVGVTTVRPTNYVRSAFHVLTGVVALAIIRLAGPHGMAVIAVGIACTAWTLETLRRLSPGVNALLMRLFSPVAHAHEQHHVNSSTWYATALAVLAVTASPLACSVAVMVLALADPAAGLVGRRWGRTTLRPGRSLEGSLTFLALAVGTALVTLRVYAPGWTWLSIALVTAAAAVPAALAELYSTRLDDNFTVPLAAGLGVSLAIAVLGLA